MIQKHTAVSVVCGTLNNSFFCRCVHIGLSFILTV